MSSYLAEVRKLEKHFFDFQIQHIPRKENFLADQLARMASTRATVPPGVFLEQLDSPSVVEPSEIMHVSFPVVQTDRENMDAP
ncbi:reverse transcriptase-like protein [Salmonella enterica subsp. enterica serovar Goldcoast]|nr:reverse transcriptase-like protein [Salmonella enterica subsp. enterica serovar Goldcoast]